LALCPFHLLGHYVNKRKEKCCRRWASTLETRAGAGVQPNAQVS